MDVWGFPIKTISTPKILKVPLAQIRGFLSSFTTVGGSIPKKDNIFPRKILPNARKSHNCKSCTPMSYSILNLSNVYGPRQDPHGEAGVMSIFTGKMLNNEKPIIYGDGNQTRDYVYVLDVVSALIKSSENDNDLFLNIGTGVETSVNELVSLIALKTSWEGEPDYKPQRDGELLRSVLNNNKAKKSLDWEPEYDLNKGIEELVDWFKNS